VDAPYGKSFFYRYAVIGCFHMSGLFVRHTFAAGPDGNPPVRSLIKLARLRGALNQTGLPLHWLDRYASSTAIANLVRAARG
jgi:hypothetical protein